jgi:hypothetical protein
MVASGVNEMIFAIDGMDGPSYTPYRVGGDFEIAYRFMKEFSLAAHDANPAIRRVWKYVIFEHNDGAERLLRAQELALEARITEMRFIITQLGPMSSDILDESHVPRFDPALNVTVVNYRVQYAQLSAAMADLRSSLRASDLARAGRTAEFVSHMMFRLFRSASRIPEAHRRLIDELLELSSGLPSPTRARLRTELDLVRASVQARALQAHSQQARIEKLESSLAAVTANNNRLFWKVGSVPRVAIARMASRTVKGWLWRHAPVFARRAYRWWKRRTRPESLPTQSVDAGSTST